ncbi:hypothetical protein K443DRAFT_677775 [Laccaria amethystina LaAM-08-1]|uniref:Uncharacterized protein n=1 Tax=Laccaria amethystina LaAM-08-1 TaxID=1095629 RepID=A0A0C9XL44_9AGAR|nr:hypothetical protein K443DRAFT_677775 [Laccaria amethystina LaAM-08-1]
MDPPPPPPAYLQHLPCTRHCKTTLQQAFQQDQEKLSGTQGYMHHNEANLGPELLSCILHPRKYDWP